MPNCRVAAGPPVRLRGAEPATSVLEWRIIGPALGVEFQRLFGGMRLMGGWRLSARVADASCSGAGLQGGTAGLVGSGNPLAQAVHECAVRVPSSHCRCPSLHAERL